MGSNMCGSMFENDTNQSFTSSCTPATTRHEIEVGFESYCDIQEWKNQGKNNLRRPVRYPLFDILACLIAQGLLNLITFLEVLCKL